MPKKRKGGNLNIMTREGRRLQKRRKIESLEERSQRLEADAQRHAQQRVNENDEARFQRLEADAQRHAQQRVNENDEARFQRLEANAQRQVQRRQNTRQLNHHIALIAKDDEINVPVYTLGQMNIECQFCKSLNFECEKPK